MLKMKSVGSAFFAGMFVVLYQKATTGFSPYSLPFWPHLDHLMARDPDLQVRGRQHPVLKPRVRPCASSRRHRHPPWARRSARSRPGSSRCCQCRTRQASNARALEAQMSGISDFFKGVPFLLLRTLALTRDRVTLARLMCHGSEIDEISHEPAGGIWSRLVAARRMRTTGGPRYVGVLTSPSAPKTNQDLRWIRAESAGRRRGRGAPALEVSRTHGSSQCSVVLPCCRPCVSHPVPAGAGVPDRCWGGRGSPWQPGRIRHGTRSRRFRAQHRGNGASPLGGAEGGAQRCSRSAGL